MKKDNQERKLRALIYCRVSTAKQEEEGSSLDSQEQACNLYANERGYEIVNSVREQFSGAYLFDRPLFNVERERIRNGEYDVVVVYAVDRLSRNLGQLSIILEECERGGAKLEFVTEQLEDTPEARLLLSVKGYVAEIEREKIKERCVRGKKTKALAGKLNNASDLYGYVTDRANKCRMVKDKEAEIVKRIYHEYLNGGSIRGIAELLNGEGIDSPAVGKKNLDAEPSWGKSTISRILKEPAYYGKSFSFRYKGVSGTEKGKRFNRTEVRDQAEWIALPDTVTPAIVTAETWEAVEERLERNKTIARPSDAEVLFRGMVECGTCHSPMYFEMEKGTRKIFRCSTRCGARRINAEKCEEAIWNQLAEIIRNPRIIKDEMKRRTEDGGNGRRALEREIECKKASLNKIENDITRLTKRALEIDDDLVYKTAMEQVTVKRQERERMTLAVAEAEQNLVSFDAEKAGIKDATIYFRRVSRKLDRFGFQQKKMAVEALNVKIVGNGKDLLVRYSLPFEKQECRSNDAFYRPSRFRQDDAGEAAADHPPAA